uniref:Uncharacterized protein n=1 Tax=Oryza sativa subsp. japonica TaxID=39947 RepID=Q7X602_ORYSJ|nr:hypothetical protein [Oryza sativa Japonica Group]BAC80098.1 hypothetical protein [Oryza sativa Japonica Group]
MGDLDSARDEQVEGVCGRGGVGASREEGLGVAEEGFSEHDFPLGCRLTASDGGERSGGDPDLRGQI